MLHLGESLPLPLAAFGRRYSPLEERLSQLEDEIPRLEGDLDFLRMGLLDIDELGSTGAEFVKQLGELEGEDKRALVESLTTQIVVGKEDVTIRLVHMPFRLQDMTTSQRTACGFESPCLHHTRRSLCLSRGPSALVHRNSVLSSSEKTPAHLARWLLR